jgi:CHAT domain-containing protein
LILSTILPNLLELLVNIPNGIKHISVDVPGDKFKETAILFHRNLQKRGGAFVKQSRQLHDWLIKPITSILNQLSVQVIVIVPDGVFRLIPIAALMPSKKSFLIQDYAIATTPSLYLTEPKALDSDISMILNGVSESVQGFTPLKHVQHELISISSLMKGDSFLDSQFKLNDLVHNLKSRDYHVIHVATHAQFNRNPSKTFILTYDDKLTMNKLESLFEDKSVELLTLSACQTAKGDERAALGLAGVAIKAGARSALASLWAVQDKSTALLMQEFYKGLNGGLSKAKALQQAQIKLISQKKFRHPNYWAPFLLIGNWL